MSEFQIVSDKKEMLDDTEAEYNMTKKTTYSERMIEHHTNIVSLI